MKKFQTESISRYINHLYRKGVSFLGSAYKDYNIGAGQYQFLVYLYMNDGITHEELTEKIGVDKAATTRSLAKLEEFGYIKREKDKDDKRKQKIYLTEYAKSQREEIVSVSRTWEQELVGNLSEEELAQLYYLFRKMTNSELNEDYKSENI